jgi:hypothetical protein
MANCRERKNHTTGFDDPTRLGQPLWIDSAKLVITVVNLPMQVLDEGCNKCINPRRTPYKVNGNTCTSQRP